MFVGIGSLADWLVFREQNDGDIEANKVARVMVRESVGGGFGGARDKGIINEDGDDTERLYQSVRTLTSESELLRLIRSNDAFGNQQQTNADSKYERVGEEISITAIMFHSHFDPSCHRAQHKFRKITNERSLRKEIQKEKQRTAFPSCTIMARIESSILSDTTLKLLGIHRYPHIQKYRRKPTTTTTTKTNNNNNNNECVASFSIPQSFVFSKMLHESLDIIEQRTPEEWTEFYKQHCEEMEIQQLALDGIVQNTRERQQWQQFGRWWWGGLLLNVKYLCKRWI